LAIQRDIRKGWGDGVSAQLFSAPKRQGVEEAQLKLAELLGTLEEGQAER
jgi:GTP-binding protein